MTDELPRPSFLDHVEQTYLRADPVILLTRDGPGDPGEINLERTTLAAAIERRGVARVDLVRLDLSQAAAGPLAQLAAAAKRWGALAFVTFNTVPAATVRVAIAEQLAAGFGAVYGYAAGAVVRLAGPADIAGQADGVLCVSGDGVLRPAILVLDQPLPQEAAALTVAPLTMAPVEIVPVAPIRAADPPGPPRLALQPEDRMLDRRIPRDAGRRREPDPGAPGFLADLAWLVVAIAVALLLEGAAGIDYRRPLLLAGEHLRFLAAARALIDSGDLWHNPFLGFPLGPTPFGDAVPALLPEAALWLLGQGGVGVFAVAKLFLLGSIAATTLGAYLALRMLGIRAFVAAAAAVAFTVSPYAAALAFGREFLAFSMAVPFGGLLAFIVAGRLGPAAGRFGRGGQGLLACLAVLVVGLSGVPYAALAAVFVAAAGIAATIGQRRPSPFLAMIAVLVALGGLALVGWFGPRLGEAVVDFPRFAAVAPERSSGGLSLVDTLLTVPRFKGMGGQIVDFGTLPVVGTGDGRGLWPGLALSLLILLAPLVVLGRLSAPAVPLGRPGVPERPRLGIGGFAAALILFGLLLFLRGGAGFLIPDELAGAIGSPERLIPFLAFLATILAARVAERCLARRRALPGLVGVVIPLLLLAAAVPSAGGLQREQARTLQAADYPATLSGLETLIARKDAAGLSAILQLPVAPLPPGGPRPNPTGSRQLLPFLFDRAHPPARWSAGLGADQPGLAGFRAAIHPAIDPAGLAARARRLGFDGILLDKKALSPDTLAALQAGLVAGLRAGCTLVDGQSWSLFRLTGTDQGQPCLIDPAPPPPLSYSIDLRSAAGPRTAAADILGEGWVDIPGSAGVQATDSESTLLLPVPGGEGDVAVALTLSAGGGPPRTLSLTLEGKQLGQTMTIGTEGGGEITPPPLLLPRPLLAGAPFFRLGILGLAPAGQKPAALLAVQIGAASAR